MRHKRQIFFVLLVIAAFGIGRWFERRQVQAADGVQSRVLYYHDPMHPAYKSDKPGIAPDCGMALVAVYAGAAVSFPEPVPIAGAVKISPEQQQLIGLQVGSVERGSGESGLRTIGKVVADESRIYRVTSKMEGWIRHIYPSSTGSLVKKGDPLLSVYSRDVQTAQQGYLFAMNQIVRFNSGDQPDAAGRLQLALTDARANLESLGMSPRQLDQLAETRKIFPAVDIAAPQTGFVFSRSVYADQKFDRGTELYRLVDLTHVWVLADIYEQDANKVAPGAPARITVPQLGAEPVIARVANVLPQMDPGSRTLKVRLEIDNPGFRFKPDMFVDVEFSTKAVRGLTVPADAVLDSGMRKTVFISLGNGYFEPREIVTGTHSGDRISVLSGLKEGEAIVTAGTFLLDSESRLKTRGPA